MAAAKDRILASLFGGALGDAIGADWEGSESATTFRIPDTLSITDDTQFTLATCASIASHGKPDPELVAREFTTSYRGRRFSRMGSSTLKALIELDAGGHWASVGATGDRAAGNGAAMRIAPLAFCIDPDESRGRRIIRDICNITHRNDEAYTGALAMVLAIQHALGTEQLSRSLFATLVEKLPDSNVRDRFVFLRDQPMTVGEYAAKFGSTGYVADSVPMAVLAAINSEGFEDSLQVIASCGGDTDTIGSMFGQIYGAAKGTAALPMELVDRIDDQEFIRESFRRFTTTVRGIA